MLKSGRICLLLNFLLFFNSFILVTLQQQNITLIVLTASTQRQSGIPSKYSGVETFDSLDESFNNKEFKSSFSNSKIKGSYKNLKIKNYDENGGALRRGSYSQVSYGNTTTLKLKYDKSFTVAQFSCWVSAMDYGNEIVFYSAAAAGAGEGEKADVLYVWNSPYLGRVPSLPEYKGNPNYSPKVNTDKFYAFLVFDVKAGLSIGKIEFKQNVEGKYFNTDNHSFRIVPTENKLVSFFERFFYGKRGEELDTIDKVKVVFAVIGVVTAGAAVLGGLFFVGYFMCMCLYGLTSRNKHSRNNKDNEIDRVTQGQENIDFDTREEDIDPYDELEF